MANKSSIQYPYAYSENRELVHIDSVAKENRYEHSFICPCCGRKMLPRLGDINAHCFAHADNQKCGIESYIHKVAKLILAKRFNEKRSFIIGLLRSSNSCKNFESCPDYDKFLCYCPKDYHEYDLAKYYDLPAQIEVDIIEPDGITHYRPDLLLQSSNHNRKDIFIEVYHKHKSSKEKISSGHQIIEIRIKDMASLKLLENESYIIKEDGKDVLIYNFKPLYANPESIEKRIREYAAECGVEYLPEDSLPVCRQSKKFRRSQFHLQRFILYKSLKSFSTGIYEHELGDHKPSALMDITYDLNKIDKPFNPLKELAVRDNRARFCDFCEHRTMNLYDHDWMWCNLGKNGTTKKGTYNNTKGTSCQFFEWRIDPLAPTEVLSEFEEGKDFTIWINPDIK